MPTVRWESSRPLDLRQSTARFTRWGADPVNVVVGDTYCRVVAGTVYAARQVGAQTVELQVDGDPDAAVADLAHRLAEDLPELSPAARTVAAVADQATRMPGYRPPLVADPFEALVTAISAQQVNLTWATTTRRRLVEAYGRSHQIDGIVVHGFPHAGVLATVAPEELRAMQFTTRKAEYIVGLAQAAVEGHLDDLHTMTNADVIERVVAIRGIGRWSAEWLLARCLGRGDVVAAGDLGVRKAVSRFVLATDIVAAEGEVRDAVAGWGDGANWAVHLLLERLAAA